MNLEELKTKLDHMKHEANEITYMLKPDLDPKQQNMAKKRAIARTGLKQKSATERLFCEAGKEHHILKAGGGGYTQVRT